MQAAARSPGHLGAGNLALQNLCVNTDFFREDSEGLFPPLPPPLEVGIKSLLIFFLKAGYL